MLSGSCLCGAVRYETPEDPVYALHCYCATCRRESGAGHLTVVAVREEGFKITGELKVTAPTRANGAPPIPRSFCPNCGSVLFGRPPSMPHIINLRAGTLDGTVELQVKVSAFASQAQPWDQPPTGVPMQG